VMNATKKRSGLGESVLQKLPSSLHHSYYIVMIDNYFTSLELFVYLKSLVIYACGTVHPNHIGLPKLANDKDLQKGEFDFRTSDQGILYFKWRDNRVHLLHTTTIIRTQKVWYEN
jgi:hypothetical protein